MQMSEARRTNIRVIGPVQYPEIAWRHGLTLALALSTANYTDARDPRTIVVSRQRERIELNPEELLRGKDLDLEPGDTIEIHP